MARVGPQSHRIKEKEIRKQLFPLNYLQPIKTSRKYISNVECISLQLQRIFTSINSNKYFELLFRKLSKNA